MFPGFRGHGDSPPLDRVYCHPHLEKGKSKGKFTKRFHLVQYLNSPNTFQGFLKEALHTLPLLSYVALCVFCRAVPCLLSFCVVLCYVKFVMLGCFICFVCVVLFVLCYVMLCYVMLCYVMLCYVMLCYVVLCNVAKKCVLSSEGK